MDLVLCSHPAIMPEDNGSSVAWLISNSRDSGFPLVPWKRD